MEFQSDNGQLPLICFLPEARLAVVRLGPALREVVPVGHIFGVPRWPRWQGPSPNAIVLNCCRSALAWKIKKSGVLCVA